MNIEPEQCKSAFYVFDVAELKGRIDYLRRILPKTVDLCYAIKANTFITGELIGTVDRFEVCSPGEAEICRLLNVPENQMVISGVYKTPQVMDNMVANTECNRIFTVESINQFQLLKGLSEKHKKNLKLLIRLTNGSQFGVNANEIEDIIANRESYKHLDIIGIQFFSGTQKTSLKKLKREVERLDKLLLTLKERYGYTAKELEYGPGFPATYFKEDSINEDELIGGFSQLLLDMTSKPKITLELGRSIAASCGKYYTHIVDKKCNKGENYLLVDGGMHHIVYFGQHMAMKQPILSVCGKETQPYSDIWNICGSLCSMNDIISKQVSLPPVEVGDIICFENTGAYCMTEGISLFLSRDIPAVYIKGDDGSLVCVRDPYETYLLNKPNYRKDI